MPTHNPLIGGDYSGYAVPMYSSDAQPTNRTADAPRRMMNSYAGVSVGGSANVGVAGLALLALAILVVLRSQGFVSVLAVSR